MRLNKTFFLGVVYLSLSALISEQCYPQSSKPASESWKIGEKTYKFIVKDNIVIDEDCYNKNGKCEAFAALKTINIDLITADDRAGGKNPGGQVCTKLLKGVILIGFDQAEDQQSFCLLKYGALVSTGSLHYQAVKNSEK